MNIAFVGFMGAGKTTISRTLARKTGMREVDTDRYIIRKDGREIAKIFEEDGETAFRDMETEAIKEIAAGDGQIISCGGGAVLRAENVEALKSSGTIILLRAEPETIFARVRRSKARPMLNGHMNVEYITGLMQKREPAYVAAADIEVSTDGKSPDQIAGEIIEILGLGKI